MSEFPYVCLASLVQPPAIMLYGIVVKPLGDIDTYFGPDKKHYLNEIEVLRSGIIIVNFQISGTHQVPLQAPAYLTFPESLHRTDNPWEDDSLFHMRFTDDPCGQPNLALGNVEFWGKPYKQVGGTCVIEIHITNEECFPIERCRISDSAIRPQLAGCGVMKVRA